MNTTQTFKIPAANPRWYADLERAREIDRMAVTQFGQRDPCHHFCAEQSSMRRRGYRPLRIYTNVYGWAVRQDWADYTTSIIRRGASLDEAVAYALAERAQAPDQVEIVTWEPAAIDALRAALAREQADQDEAAALAADCDEAAGHTFSGDASDEVTAAP